MKTVNWMGFGIGLGIGLGLAMAQAQQQNTPPRQTAIEDRSSASRNSHTPIRDPTVSRKHT